MREFLLDFLCALFSAEGLLIALLVALAAGLYFTHRAASSERARLMAECLADGRKEYQCASMLMRNSSDAPVPIIIPMTAPARSR